VRRKRSTRSNIVWAMPILMGVGDACESRWFGGRKSSTLHSPTRLHGVHTDSVETPCGVRVESTWIPCGVRVDSVWIPWGVRVDSVWIPCGFHVDSMRSPWIIFCRLHVDYLPIYLIKNNFNHIQKQVCTARVELTAFRPFYNDAPTS
jgi:hypothetical protein